MCVLFVFCDIYMFVLLSGSVFGVKILLGWGCGWSRFILLILVELVLFGGI